MNSSQNHIYHNPITQGPGRHRPQADDVDIKKYLFLFLENWYWFVITICLGIGIAYLINKYTVREYKVSAALLIEDENSQSSSFGTGNQQEGFDVLSGFGLFPSMKNLQNQTLILQSSSQIDTTLHKLDFEVSYFKKEIFDTREIYDEAPFVVIFDRSRPQPVGITFSVTFNNDSTFHLKSETNNSTVSLYNYLTEQFLGTSENESPNNDFRFGQPVEGRNFLFTLLPRKGIKPGNSQGSYNFSFNSYTDLLNKWKKTLSITSMEQSASMVELTINTDCPAKAMTFVNKHLDMYLQRTLNKKNQFANNTIHFIDLQLLSISDSLGKAESELQDFRKDNRAVDISFQAQSLFDEMKVMESSRADLKLKGEYYVYLKDYLQKNREAGNLVAPSVMGITDPLLNNLILELNKLESQKVAMAGTNGSINPYLATLESQIKNAKITAEETVNSLQSSYDLAMNDINKRYTLLMEEVNKLPQTERGLFSIERKFKLNDNIYTYLMQRRAEAQIAKASNAPDNEIIDRATVIGGPIKPKTGTNYMIGFFLGLVLPGVFFSLKEIFNNKIETEEEVKKLTNLPVAGHISHNLSEYQNVVLRDPQNIVSEAFRNLRTRMRFFTKELKNPVILISSSMPGEGKTFTALNLASAYSLAGHKTVLVSFDLRKPRIYDEFGINNENGLSTYLIGRDSLDQIIKKTGYENFHLIPAGPVPPNPAELASPDKIKALFAELKKRYDLIITDSAPIGYVSDTYALAGASDAVIILVRHNKTIKQLLKHTMEDCKINGINNVSVLMNDIRSDMKMYGYQGRYGYGSRYGYGKSPSQTVSGS